MGTDGKFYKVDFRGTSAAFESPEVYDVMPSQIAFVPHTGIKRDRLSSGKQGQQPNGIVGTTIVQKSSGRPHSAFRS